MLFEEKITVNKDAFLAKVKAVAARLGISPDWLMAVINSESAGTFSPSVRNSKTNAVGLIQFLPSTAIALGTTTDDLASMTNVEQLDYVEKYFYPYRNYIDSFDDLYLITFYPNADGVFAGTLSKPDNWQFPSVVAQQNNGIDTIAAFRQFIYSQIPQEALAAIAPAGTLVTTKKFILRNPIPFAIVALTLIATGIYLIVKKK